MTQLDFEAFLNRKGFYNPEKRKKEGLDNIEDSHETWLDRMRAEAIRIARDRGQVTMDDVRAYADEHNDQPEISHAWGAVFRGRGWHEVCRQKSRRPNNHARKNTVWRYQEEKG